MSNVGGKPKIFSQCIMSYGRVIPNKKHLTAHSTIKEFVTYSLYKIIGQNVIVRKRVKIRNRYNQAPYLTQDTRGKVTILQLDITNESQEVLESIPKCLHKY